MAGWPDGQVLDGWVAGWPGGWAGQVAGWLGGRVAGWPRARRGGGTYKPFLIHYKLYHKSAYKSNSNL